VDLFKCFRIIIYSQPAIRFLVFSARPEPNFGSYLDLAASLHRCFIVYVILDTCCS